MTTLTLPINSIVARSTVGFIQTGEFKTLITNRPKFACVPVRSSTTWHDTLAQAVRRLRLLDPKAVITIS